MATKLINNPVLWRAVDANTADSDTGLEGEPVIDWREGKPYMRVMDGVKLGGGVVGEGTLDYITKPAILSPLSGAVSIGLFPILQASPFIGASNDGQATHSFSIWEIAEDDKFHNTIFFSGPSTSALTVCDMLLFNVALEAETLYYARVKYVSTTGIVSSWSNPTSFTTEVPIPENQIEKKVGVTNTAGDFYGRFVAIDANGIRLMVGAYAADGTAIDSGVAHILRRAGNSWSIESQLKPAGLQGGDYAGYGIAISGDGKTAVMCAPLDSQYGTQLGSAYVYVYSNSQWMLGYKITNPTGYYLDRLGVAVAINHVGDRMILGAGWRSQTVPALIQYCGGASIYRRDGATWVEEAKLWASDVQAQAYNGRAVSIDATGSIAVVGGSSTTTVGAFSGAAYVYTRTGVNWNEVIKLQSSNMMSGDYFGEAVAISADGSTTVVGAYIANGLVEDSGAAYVYKLVNNVWTQVAYLYADDGLLNDSFGRSIAINNDGTLIAVGTSSDNGNGTNEGSVYIFKLVNGNYDQISKLMGLDGEGWDEFSRCIALSANTGILVVGAPDDDDGGASSGSIYVFE